MNCEKSTNTKGRKRDRCIPCPYCHQCSIHTEACEKAEAVVMGTLRAIEWKEL